jgi:hypothetical protein
MTGPDLMAALRASKELALKEAEEAIARSLQIEKQAEDDRLFIRRASAELRMRRGKL